MQSDQKKGKNKKCLPDSQRVILKWLSFLHAASPTKENTMPKKLREHTVTGFTIRIRSVWAARRPEPCGISQKTLMLPQPCGSMHPNKVRRMDRSPGLVRSEFMDIAKRRMFCGN